MMSYGMQAKPFQLLYYFPFMNPYQCQSLNPQNYYGMNPYTYPQMMNAVFYPIVPGTTQDNCIVIEDDQNPLNHNLQLVNQQSNNQMIEEAPIVQQPQKPLPSQIDTFDQNRPHIKISVQKQHQNQTDEEFILFNDRIVGSTLKKEILIGRKKQQEDKQENCDIYLSHGDKNVEKVHCKILTEQGFAFSNTLNKSTLLLFSIIKTHPQLSRVPFSIIKLIYSFIKEKPKFFITDVGTRNGTFMKIKKDNMKLIEMNNTYLIGADTYFHIVEMNKIEQRKKKQKNQDYLYKALAKEHLKKDAKIHGLTQNETEELNQLLQEYRTGKCKFRNSFKLSECQRPYLKLTFNSSSFLQTQTHIFLANQGQESIFKIGRSQECDVLVNINTVSRRQAQVIYKNNQWYIHDGEGIRDSANGTWQSLQDFSQRNHDKKIQSKPRLIEDQMEIKISENIIKFDYINFGPTKKRKLDKQLINELLNLQ